MNDVKILTGEAILKTINNELDKCENDLNIVSAFCKISTLKLLDEHIKENVKKRLLVRFLPSDLASGATDKEIYDYCKNNNWDLFYDFTIHAKTYVFDMYKCILGSSNLTNKGLMTFGSGNKELSALFEIENDDLNKINSLYCDAFLMDDENYAELIEFNSDEEIVKHYKKRIEKKEIKCLMPEDFPHEEINSFELKRLRSYIWLVKYLSVKECHSASFGEITEKVHNLYIKEPKPYRKEIKDLVKNLFEAIETIKPNDLIVDRPNYSEVVRLKMDYPKNL